MVQGRSKIVCDGTWAREGEFGPLKTCYKKGEAADVLWDAVKETGKEACRQIIELKPGKWNGNEVGAWCLEVGEIDYRIKD